MQNLPVVLHSSEMLIAAQGIGKTVTATFIARDAEIRKHFELLIWCTLGQMPDLSRMQSLVYLQATGEGLAPDSTSDQAKEKIRRALQGKRTLLILDDVWSTTDEQELNFVDVAVASKTLITTRIRDLGTGVSVELGVPSEADAVKLLFASAGLGEIQDSSLIPPEAAEVVQICGRLPLVRCIFATGVQICGGCRSAKLARSQE